MFMAPHTRRHRWRPGHFIGYGTLFALLMTATIIPPPHRALASPHPDAAPGANTFASLRLRAATRRASVPPIQVGLDGWSGDSETSDTVNGLGDDQWQINFPQAVRVTVSVDDCCIVGDNYEIFIDGSGIGTTPPEPLFGPTNSSGTFTQTVAPGPHLISIQDLGGIQYYNQGDTFMIPAGYFVSISIAPAVIHPIILVHGITDSAAYWGANYGPWQTGGSGYFDEVYDALQNAYPGSPVERFAYRDDVSFSATQCAPYPCGSEYAPVRTDAFQLARDVIGQYADSEHNPDRHRVALFGFSMGGAIIRSLLAGCPTPITFQRSCSTVTDVLGPCGTIDPTFQAFCDMPVVNMIDDVFFTNTVQQGSYVLGVARGADFGLTSCGVAGNLLCLALAWGGYVLFKNATGTDLGSQGAIDLTPLSGDIVTRDLYPLPTNIHYFTFYGDIQVRLTIHPLGMTITLPGAAHAGDLILLPGADAPRSPTVGGGSRFCQDCSQLSGTNVEVGGSNYTEWPLTDVRTVDANALAVALAEIGPNWGSGVCQALDNVCKAPEMHLQIYTHDAMTGIHVQDTSGEGACRGQVTIPAEVVCQLEKGDGI